MHDFAYLAAGNLQDAARLLSENRGTAKILAGGTDLIVVMRNGRQQPQLVIDAKCIPELNELVINDKGLSVGAAVSCRRIWEDSRVVQDYPALLDSASLIGGIQIQGRASIGGNLCNAAPSADAVPSLIAYGAIAHLYSTDGERQVPVEAICVAPGQTSLADNEILVKLTIASPAPHSSAKFLRFIPRNEMDIAVANVAVALGLDASGSIFKNARIAIGAVAPTPLYVREAGAALVDREVNEENIVSAAKIARDAARPIDDMRGTVAHRQQLIEVLTGRAIRAAVARAKGERK